MQYFWLLAGLGIAGYVTYMCITDGAKKWAYYYVFAALALIMFLLRRFMMKRMQRHLEYLEEKQRQEAKK